MQDLVKKVISGDRYSVAKLISAIETETPEKKKLIKEIFPFTGNAYVIGITGAAGAGKSTLVDCLLNNLINKYERIGVLAVDPTSSFSGGSVLGDRIRLNQHSTNPNIFIRSMGTRGQMGGLSHFVFDAVKVLDAAGFEIILVETAGAGQTEISIMSVVDTVLMVLTPYSGDIIQVMKAGIMEIADIFVVNKAEDRGDLTVAELRSMVSRKLTEKEWEPQVVKTVAVQGYGIEELVKSISEHQLYLKNNNLDSFRKKRLEKEFKILFNESLKNKIISEILKQKEYKKTISTVINKKSDPYSAAQELSDQFINSMLNNLTKK